MLINSGATNEKKNALVIQSVGRYGNFLTCTESKQPLNAMLNACKIEELGHLDVEMKEDKNEVETRAMAEASDTLNENGEGNLVQDKEDAKEEEDLNCLTIKSINYDTKPFDIISDNLNFSFVISRELGLTRMQYLLTNSSC